MFLVGQYLQIEELALMKQAHQLQCEDTLTSSMQLTLFHYKNKVKTQPITNTHSINLLSALSLAMTMKICTNTLRKQMQDLLIHKQYHQ